MNICTIIVTWNQTDLTLECLGALAKAGADLVDVWVVDNGSQPSALPSIHRRFPQVRTIRLEGNQGFAAGSNVGARAALLGQADYLFFLNNDAVVEPETLPRLRAALNGSPDIGAASPKVYYHGSDHVIQSVGLRIDSDSGDVRMIGSGEPDRGQHDRVSERDGLFGCALLVRRAAWEQVGGFWEPFFSYAEEVDWCLRARARGWRLLYEPGAIVWHHGGSSLGAGSPLKQYLITRNQLFLRARHRRPGLRGMRGLAYALYLNGRVAARALWLGRTAHARGVALGIWDYLWGRTGYSRAPNLRRV